MNLHIRLLLTSCFLLLLLPIAARGQESSPEPPAEEAAATATDSVEELLDRIRQTDGELVELIERAATAEGEELDLVRSEIGKLARKQRDDLTALLDRMTTGDDSEADMELLEQQGEQLLRRSSRRLRAYIQLFQSALEEEATKRPELAPSEAQVFEHRMAEETSRLDRFYLGLAQLTDQMASFDLNVEEEEAFLEQQLGERGKNLLQLMELTKKQLDQYKDLLDRSPGDSDLQARVFAAEERYHSNKTSLLATIHMMRLRGMDYLDLELRTIELTGEITPEALEVDVAVGLFQREATRARVYLVENGPKLLLRAFVILAILLIFWLLSRITRRFTGRVLDKTKISGSKLLKEMVVTMTGRAVLVVGLIFALSQLGISLGPLLAGLGIAGFIVGFALQDTLANFAAGAMILAYQPYDVGDFIEAGGVTGKVRDMNLVSTRILTVDNQTLIVPNSKIWGDVIRNVTSQPSRRVDMVFGISYEDDIPQAERVLTEIVSSHERVLDDPEAVIKVHTLNDSSVDFIVRPWAKTEDYWDVYWDITREVKMRFDREGISIPYPQRDVHLVGSESSTGDQGETES